MNKLAFPVRCTSCDWHDKVLAENLFDNNSVVCSCGQKINIVGNVRKAQKEYDYFQQALRDAGMVKNIELGRKL